MDWSRVKLVGQVVEAARVVDEGEVVIDFGDDVRAWFRVTVFEDLRPEGEERFFARAVGREDAALTALATATSPEDAATLCIAEAGVTLRRSRGR